MDGRICPVIAALRSGPGAWWNRSTYRSLFFTAGLTVEYREGVVDPRDFVGWSGALRGTARQHAWVLGVAYQYEVLTAAAVPGVDCGYRVPALFAQGEFALFTWLTLVPRQSAEFGGILANKKRGRVGLEVGYTGRQALQDDPYRSVGESYFELNALGVT